MTDFTSQHARMELLVGGELEFVAWPSDAIFLPSVEVVGSGDLFCRST